MYETIWTKLSYINNMLDIVQDELNKITEDKIHRICEGYGLDFRAGNGLWRISTTVAGAHMDTDYYPDVFDYDFSDYYEEGIPETFAGREAFRHSLVEYDMPGSEKHRLTAAWVAVNELITGLDKLRRKFDMYDRVVIGDPLLCVGSIQCNTKKTLGKQRYTSYCSLLLADSCIDAISTRLNIEYASYICMWVAMIVAGVMEMEKYMKERAFHGDVEYFILGADMDSILPITNTRRVYGNRRIEVGMSPILGQILMQQKFTKVAVSARFELSTLMIWL